jgi:copper(I)-binding protein
MIARLTARLIERITGRPVSVVQVLEPRAMARLSALALIAGAAIYGASWTHPEPSATAGSVSIIHPWARGGERMGQQFPVYVTLANSGQVQDRLVSAESPLAERVIIKELDRRDGLVSARQLDALILPPQSRQTLRPGQSQITLDRLKTTIRPGDTLPLNLQFERAGNIKVTVVVENVGQPDHPEHFPLADRIDERGGLRK